MSLLTTMKFLRRMLKPADTHTVCKYVDDLFLISCISCPAIDAVYYWFASVGASSLSLRGFLRDCKIQISETKTETTNLLSPVIYTVSQK